jgi:hypothetical protein
MRKPPLLPADSITVIGITPGTAGLPLDNVDPDAGIDPDAAGPETGIRALFVDDRELRLRLFGPSPSKKIGWGKFKGTLKQWEREGFPPLNQFRTRFYPACLEWLYEQHARRGNGCPGDIQDGPENFGRHEHATTRQSPRSQARSRPQGRNGTVVLDGETSRAQPDGLPRLVHPPPARR